MQNQLQVYWKCIVQEQGNLDELKEKYVNLKQREKELLKDLSLL